MPWPKGKPRTREQKRKTARALVKFYSNPAARKRMSEIKKAQYKANPELRKKIDRVITAWWRDNPNVRKRISEGMKQFFIKNPKAFQEFLKHGKNPLKRHIRTKQGFKVRSRGEQQIANFLHENNLPCQYESISLPITKKPYAGNICTPDFFLPNWNIFIEFYGGYPLAWKKKVLKNKIYKSHRIPVLAITPGELEDLDYYLLRQGKTLSQTQTAKNFKIKNWIK